jgi:hypothetical protein
MTIDQDLKDVLGQIAWATGLAKTCKPFTPTDAQREGAWKKLRNESGLRWGCKLSIVWADNVAFMEEEFGKDWEKTEQVDHDTGYLIALPGSRCTDEGSDGVVWISEINEEKGGGEPCWMQLWVLLSNPMVAWVEVVK